jgi:predicted homoserine dehydrogenase-like protein
LTRDISKDEVLTRDDVILQDGRLCDKFRTEQDRFFAAGRASSAAKPSKERLCKVV